MKAVLLNCVLIPYYYAIILVDFAVKSAVAVCGCLAELKGRICWHRQCQWHSWQCGISVNV